MALIKEDLAQQILDTYVDVMKNGPDASARLHAADQLRWIVQSVEELESRGAPIGTQMCGNLGSSVSPFKTLIR